MKLLTDTETTAIEANLFHRIRPLVRSHPNFPWHRNGKDVITTGQPNSSQALALDFFGTISTLSSLDAILGAWMEDLSLVLGGPWKVELEYLLPRELVGEPRQSQIDVLATGSAGLVLFECKFTEQDGGGCSQTDPLQSGAHEGIRQCNGDFVEQVNPVNGIRARCALTGKGIKYWDLVPEVLNIDAQNDHNPCPFAGGWYQWMRNLVAARALGIKMKLPSAFVIVYADGPFPMARKVSTHEWSKFTDLAKDRTVPLRTVSYQALHAVALNAVSRHDRPILDELDVWTKRKFSTVSNGPKPPL